jgi:hypothetical protein
MVIDGSPSLGIIKSTNHDYTRRENLHKQPGDLAPTYLPHPTPRVKQMGFDGVFGHIDQRG